MGPVFNESLYRIRSKALLSAVANLVKMLDLFCNRFVVLFVLMLFVGINDPVVEQV
jgi:hypothetical protein